MQYIDLTHTFTDSMPVYPGDAHPKLERIADFEGQGFVDHKLSAAMHVGTHMDAPLHMIENGEFVSDIELSRFFGKGKLVDARKQKVIIDESVLAGVRPQAGDMVLVYTGWSKYFHHADYYKDYPEFSQGFAESLVKAKVSAVGLDTPSPDRPPFLVHKILLAAGIVIIENLTNLKSLLDKKFDVVALPVKLKTDASPCRVIALL
jgi:kynurenine formamidase